MDYLFNVEIPLPVKLVIAFAVVLALLGLVMWVFKRFGGARLGAPPARGRQPRLAVIDAAAIDGRRRLVLIRRDNVEHLVMIGGPTDVLIEQNILRAVPVAPPRDAQPPRAPMEGLPPRAPVEPIPRAAPEPGMRSPRQEVPPPPRAPRNDIPQRRSTDHERFRADPGRGPSDTTTRSLRLAPAPMAMRDADTAPETGALSPEATIADMAHKLEVALKRPGARGPEPDTPARTPALSEPTPPTAPELSGPPPSPRPSPAPAAPPFGAKPEAKATSNLLDSLEEEMASLLNRPDGSPPEKK